MAWIGTTVGNSARKIAIIMSRAPTVRFVGTARGGIELGPIPIWIENSATLDLMIQLDCRGGIVKTATIQWDKLQWKSRRIKQTVTKQNVLCIVTQSNHIRLFKSMAAIVKINVVK